MATKTEEKARFDTRLPKEQKDLFEKAAQLGGFRSLTDFVILAAQEKAKMIIQEKERVVASQKDSEIFFNAIVNADKPGDRLISAKDKFNKALSE
jgi:uncharacterized protein (DUF1778 family)